MRDPRGEPPAPAAPPRPIDARAVLRLAWRVLLIAQCCGSRGGCS